MIGRFGHSTTHQRQTGKDVDNDATNYFGPPHISISGINTPLIKSHLQHRHNGKNAKALVALHVVHGAGKVEKQEHAMMLIKLTQAMAYPGLHVNVNQQLARDSRIQKNEDEDRGDEEHDAVNIWFGRAGAAKVAIATKPGGTGPTGRHILASSEFFFSMGWPTAKMPRTTWQSGTSKLGWSDEEHITLALT
ncbi:uncharacterized protein MONBRDRAFT_5930 [Monosiga brevicollis MX1]|uniref:Uncharacterized protein n=1 Tax=Monosiga brevicollis TaxID=81824 RepID=A9UR31_MONBE|nr:uncharacterized protein MONBRDRAFT_5930 [Monosiga brevicollis MX1]EDQ92176.1 predicted protein [Monosiga brevicollis MX1]|eukprot:XP_001743462.1 hypothetical protein [Monosiga brevicollis MX1]